MVDEVLTSYGLDSLVAAEMRNWVTQTKGSIEELADKVAH